MNRALHLAPPMLASKPLTPPPEGFPGVGGHVTGDWLPHPVPGGLSSEANCAGVNVATLSPGHNLQWSARFTPWELGVPSVQLGVGRGIAQVR